jgi:molybdopterin synthase sulfur carrier subunit
MSVVVRIPTPLRQITNGQDKVSVDGDNLSQMIVSLESQYPGIRERLVDEAGDLRHFVNIYVNGEDMRFLEGLDTGIKTGDEISIVPAVAGGAW